VGRRDLGDDREPEARPVGRRSEAALEDALAVLLGDTGAVVGDGEALAPGEVTDRDGDGVAAVFDRVTGEILDELPEPGLVGEDGGVGLDAQVRVPSRS
jgi:hypothetical protein